jgi:osmotically-inducible protein OsmY
MRANPRFQAVFLETDGRRVQLSGSVGSDADRDDLVRALQAVDGVNEVIATDLQVEAP